MNSNTDKAYLQRYRSIAAAVTAAVVILVLLWMLLAHLSYTPSDGGQWPPKADSATLLVAEEFILPENIAAATGGGADGEVSAESAGNDLSDGGKVVDEPPTDISQTTPSPVTTPKAKPAPASPSKEELERRQQQERAAKAAAEAASRMHFASDATGSGGETTKGSGAGAGGSNGRYRGSAGGALGGRSISVDGSGIVCSSPGRVVVKIWATPEGNVTKAELVASSTTISDSSVRNECIQRARRAKVAPLADAPAQQWGTVTFNFQ